jgi:hypothetical protein
MSTWKWPSPSVWRSLAAIAYLTFCYTVHNRMVPVPKTTFTGSAADIGYFHSKSLPSCHLYATFSIRKVGNNLRFHSSHRHWTLAAERSRWKHQGNPTVVFIVLGFIFWMKQSEEFFRTLHAHDGGVPLAAVNGISIPSSGMLNTVLAIIRSHCSPYLTVAFVAGLLSVATSIITPAARKFIHYLFKILSLTASSVCRNRLDRHGSDGL